MNIYEDDIPADSIEPVGQLTAQELRNINKDIIDYKWNVEGTFIELFKNNPEEKAIKAHIKQNFN